jgi:hypothetical protein
MRVPVYQPGIQVKLFKTIKRTLLDDGTTPTSSRFQNMGDSIDLVPYLGEGGSVRTTKSVRDAAGGFSITMTDRPFHDGSNTLAGSNFETMYGLIEPMDFIEIRMRHDPVAAGSKPPIVMRGFVSDVQRNEAMGADGRPMRTVVINGQDYGKLWQQMRIIYWPGYVLGQDVLSNFKLFTRFGVGFKTVQKGTDFVREVISKVFNPYLTELMPASSPNPKEILVDTVADVPGVASVTGPQNQDGTIYELLRQYLDVGVWNELFLEDREDGVHVVYRTNPFKAVSGEPIQDGSTIPDLIDVPASDVISLSVSRSDANVANYYWVRAPRFDLNSEVFRKQYALGADKKTLILDTYDNAKDSLYGVRLMDTETQMGGEDVTSFNSGQDKDTIATRDVSMSNWVNDRRRILVEQNRDNVVLEQGSMRIRGRPDIRAGSYVNLKRGTFSAEYYVPQVSHEYMPMQGFFSTVSLERGTGFVERAKRDGGASTPYLAEMASGDTK